VGQDGGCGRAKPEREDGPGVPGAGEESVRLIPIVYNSNVAGAGEERVERYYCTEERTPWRAR
jgi:hypothetical protein